MANSSSKPLQAANSRVYIIDGRARGDHKPAYESCLRMTGLSQGYGDLERVECPDPYQFGKFIEVATIRGATERPTTTLEGRYAIDLLSTLLTLARKGCTFDVQLHMGDCTDPSVFNDYKKVLVLEAAYLINFGTDDLGALASGDNAVVNENADLSGRDAYELRPMTVGSAAGTVVTNEVLDVVICDSVQCGDCGEQSDGCETIFALTTSAGGSPGTPADIVFSLDKGVTWAAHDVDSLLTAEAPNALDCIGQYLVVVANATDSIHYALKSDFDGFTDPAWTEIATGIVAAGSPNDIHSTGGHAFIVGDGGYIYETEDPTAGVTVISAGGVTTDNLLQVHSLSPTMAVAVGNNGAVLYTLDGSTWVAATRPVGVGTNLTAVFMKSEFEWWIGSSAGRLYYTLNKGETWTEKAFPGSGTGRVDEIQFATDSVVYLAHATTVPRGRVLRSIDGGYSFVVLPEGSGSLPLNDRVNAIAVCKYDPNFFVGVGLGDDAADGIILVGEAS